MLALKKPPIKTLYGNTNDASTIPDYIPSFLYPPKKSSKKHSFTSALHSGPFYEDGHLILANSFNTQASKDDKEHDIWNARVLKRLPGNYLVDVQRIWEGYDGRWLQNAPLLLRFETIDVVLSPESNGKGILVWTGYLDTNAPIFVMRNNSQVGRETNERSCLQWLPYRREAHLIGKQVCQAHLLRLVSSEDMLTPTFVKTKGEKSNHSIFVLSLEKNLSYSFLNKNGTLVMCTQ
mgnify:FL=1